MNILHRMLMRELIKVFLLSLVSVTGLFLLGGLVHEASQRGLSPGQVLAIIPLLVPSMMPWTIPATTLFATCVVYGRLAHDNEYTAIKAAGVNPLTLLRPALILGLITSGTTIGLYYDLIPRTQQLMRQSVISNSEAVLYSQLKRDGRLRYDKFPYVMFVRDVQGKRLIDVIFKRRADVEKPWLGYDLIARAREARLRIDQHEGIGYVDMDRCVVYGEGSDLAGNLQHRSFPFPLPEALTGDQSKNRPMALTWVELRARQVEAGAELAKLQADLDQALADYAAMPPGPAQTVIQIHAAHLTNQVEGATRHIKQLDTEIQMRPAIAFGCFCFVLVGVPMGIWFSRADYLSSFVSCFLPVIIVYYPLLLCGMNLAREGKFPIIPAVWTANVVLLIAGSIMTWRLVRR